MDKTGAVLVIGGGIGGTQSSLDLAQSGFKVYVAEKTTGIGGVMAQLDKTFPTNDCAMCIVSPKLVELGRHPNINLIINTEIVGITGEAGNFTVTIKKKSLFIDPEKCTGCGVCGNECPIEAIDTFNEGLADWKATFVKYPQAVPLVYAINPDICIGCGVCAGVCKANAVQYDQKDELVEIKVGAIILAPGFDEFDPTSLEPYGYGKFDNVVNSIEFERILSASGPFSGMVLRPSDGEIPAKVAFLQCIGSRDCHHAQPYCSSVCCMYTAKEALIAKEHQSQVNPTIFSMDIRAYGKDFDKYIERAQNEYGIRYIRSRISSIVEDPETDDLLLSYETENGKIITETFNMVVLAVGLNPPKYAKHLSEVLGFELNEYGFCQTLPFEPSKTTKPGIFVCGAFASPKDIPETVIQASAAAGHVNMILSDARNTLVTEKEYPAEIEVEGEEPRIGVFVCHCGTNIGGYVKVPEVVKYAENLPGVVYVERNLYTCSADTQTKIQEKIIEHNLNRVLVASCTPRTHEPLFQETIKGAGLNPYLFQMVNIRDQCSWVHMHEPVAATEKSKDLVSMGVAGARNLEPLHCLKMEVIKKALVIGGGISGMNAALGFAEEGYETFIIEKENELGGFAKNIHATLEGYDVQKYIQEKIKKINSNSKIKVFTGAIIKNVSGFVGNFQTTIVIGADQEEQNLDHGVVVVATGANEYQPKEFLYGEDDRVITQIELEKKINSTGISKKINKIIMIQCVGSRNEEHPYCSRVCCSEAIKNALSIKERYPEKEVIILYRDIRTYGFKEKYYREARNKGVIFIRFENDSPPEISEQDGHLLTVVKAPIGNVCFNTDLLVLSVGIIPPYESNERLAPMLKVPLNDDRFFLEGHVKLKPVDFATEGVFLCGLAHSPKSIEESIMQSNAVVSRATIILSQDEIESEGMVAFVDEEKCIGCNVCGEVCAFGAIGVKTLGDGVEGEKLVSTVNPLLCKGCGSCAAVCPADAIKANNFTSESIHEMISESVKEHNIDPKIIAFLCNWCSYAGADLAGVSRFQYPPNVRVIRVMCSGRIDANFVLQALIEGADGVFIGGCHLGDCHYLEGNYHALARYNKLVEQLKETGINTKRVRLEWISANEGKRFAEMMDDFISEVKSLKLIGLKIEGEKETAKTV